MKPKIKLLSKPYFELMDEKTTHKMRYCVDTNTQRMGYMFTDGQNIHQIALMDRGRWVFVI